jgi:3'-phosphoadenosine 5'-phosphosulfate sulfotransferase (PAPS reductase)/FAD synthetase
MRATRPDLDIDYFFTDTGKELPEVYEFLGRLEGFLGKTILRLNPDRGFDFWLREYNYYLPSASTRWCTKMLKIKPFESWVRMLVQAGYSVKSYVAIRADEPDRLGMISRIDGLDVEFPLKAAGIDLQGVQRLLDDSGVGLPTYYDWRSRSGCTFCFFQRKIEWVRLREKHPEAFEEAKGYEKAALDRGTPFTWSASEALTDLERPERVAEIERKEIERQAQRKASRTKRWWVDSNAESELDLAYVDEGESCLVCHK